MKRKVLPITVLAILCLLLLSCGVQPVEPNLSPVEPDFGTQSWYEAIESSVEDTTDFAGKIVIDTAKEDKDGNIYYLCDGGVWCYDFSTQTSKCIVERTFDFGAGFCVHDNAIYYLSSENTIARMNLDNPDESEILVDQGLLETVPSYEGWIHSVEYVLNDDLLVFMDSGTSSMAYHLETGEVFRLNGVSNSILDGMLYYAKRKTYSIYRRPLSQPDAEEELLLGTEGGWGQKDWQEGDPYKKYKIMYDQFWIFSGSLYFMPRWPACIYKYDPSGKHKMIYEFSDPDAGFSYEFIFKNDKLYFAAQQDILQCYDFRTGTTTIVCEDKDFEERIGIVRILKDRVFFEKINSDGSCVIRSVELKG